MQERSLNAAPTISQPKVYRNPVSVGIAAKICKVSSKTILNWIYKKYIKVFTTGGGHYRIWPADLYRFVHEAGIDVPFDFVDEREVRFLIVSGDARRNQAMREQVLRQFPNANVVATPDGYESLLLLGGFRPHFMLLDPKLPDFDGFHLLELVKKRREALGTRVLFLTESTGDQLREIKSLSTEEEAVSKRGKNPPVYPHMLKIYRHSSVPAEIH